MKNSIIVDKLITKQIEALTKFCTPSLFQKETELIYQGHVPIAGYFIKEGSAKFYKKKNLVATIGQGSLFGVHELFNKIAMPYSVQIDSNSKVCILDKSTVKELLHRIELNQFPRIFEAFVI